ncbi:MAG TPA: fused MFS/spermidine synthase, partial [Mycobacteriales bacterium]|nr:fused MFS/spermidine synthase [Mycobacteriales bacterium]
PGSPQIVLEPDAALTAVVRARLPLPARNRIRIRAVDGRSGVAELRDASADIAVLDAFLGGRVPAELGSREFVDELDRVLRPGGVFLANVADGPPLTYSRRLAAAIRTALPEVLVFAEPGVLKRRRFGNVVIAASRDRLPREAIRRSAAAALFPRSVSTGFGRDAKPLTDADPMRSPQPPDAIWRVGDWPDDPTP